MQKRRERDINKITTRHVEKERQKEIGEQSVIERDRQVIRGRKEALYTKQWRSVEEKPGTIEEAYDMDKMRTS